MNSDGSPGGFVMDLDFQRTSSSRDLHSFDTLCRDLAPYLTTSNDPVSGTEQPDHDIPDVTDETPSVASDDEPRNPDTDPSKQFSNATQNQKSSLPQQRQTRGQKRPADPSRPPGTPPPTKRHITLEGDQHIVQPGFDIRAMEGGGSQRRESALDIGEEDIRERRGLEEMERQLRKELLERLQDVEAAEQMDICQEGQTRAVPSGDPGRATSRQEATTSAGPTKPSQKRGRKKRCSYVYEASGYAPNLDQNLSSVRQKAQMELPKRKTKEECRRACQVRNAFSSAFRVKFDRDFRRHESASKEDVKAYDVSANTGPDKQDLKIDFYSKKLSRWNSTIIDLVFEQVPGSKDMSPEETEAYKKLIWEKLMRVKCEYKNALPKKKESGDYEEQHDIENRLKDASKQALETVRRNTRRYTLFQQRVRTCLVKLPSGPQWVFLAHLLIILGTDGMSSDESESSDAAGDDSDSDIEFHVKDVPWRNESLIPHLKYIDKQIPATVSKQGSRPRTRVRDTGDVNPSKRPAPRGLPKNVYGPKWLEGMSWEQIRAREAATKVFPLVGIHEVQK